MRRTVLVLVVVGLVVAAVLAVGPVVSRGSAGRFWRTERLDTPKFISPTRHSLAVDPDGNPHIAYGRDFLYYAHHDGNDWQIETVGSLPGTGVGASLGLDQSGAAHILHQDTVNQRVLVVTNATGSWVTDVIPDELFGPVELDVGATLAARVLGDVAIGPDGTVHLLLENLVRGELRLITNRTGAWTSQVIRELPTESYNTFTNLFPQPYYSIDPSITLDAVGNLHVVGLVPGDAYFPILSPNSTRHPGVPLYGTDASGTWQWEVVDTSPNDLPGQVTFRDDPDVAIDPLGRVAMVYHRTLDTGPFPDAVFSGTHFDLAVISNASGSWLTTVAEEYPDSPATIPTLSFDAAGNAHVAASLGDTVALDRKLIHLTNATGAWVRDTIEVTEPGRYPSLVSRGPDDVRVVHMEGPRLRYVDGEPGAFSSQVVDVEARSGSNAGLTYDGTGVAYVSHRSGEQIALHTRTGPTWDRAVLVDGLEFGTGTALPFVIDRDGHHHFGYVHRNAQSVQEVVYATNRSGALISHVLSTGPFAFNGPGLAIAANGEAHVAFGDGQNGTRYATNAGGTWVEETVQTGAASFDHSIALDASGKAHVVFQLGGGIGDRRVVHATNASGAWVTDKIVDGIDDYTLNWPSLFLDGNGNVHVAFNDRVPEPGNAVGDDVLRYATNAGGSWVVETISDAGGTSSLLLDDAGAVHIAHAANDLFHTSNASGQWRTIAVDTGAGGARAFPSNTFEVREGEQDGVVPVVTNGTASLTRPSLRLAPDGCAQIAYGDATLGDLKFAELTDTPPAAVKTIDFATGSGTATDGADYTASNGTLGWPSDDTGSRTFRIAIEEDDLLEGTEIIPLTLANPSDGVILGRSHAVLRVLDASLPAGAVDSYFLPRKVAVKANRKHPTKSFIKAVGFFDTGSGITDLSGPAILSVGPFSFEVPGFAAEKNGSLRYRAEAIDLRLTPAKSGSSRAKFRLRYTGDLAGRVGPSDGLALRLAGGTVKGLAHIGLRRGRFKLGKVRGTLSAPVTYLFEARAKVAGGGRDSLTLKAGLGKLGDTPDAAPDVRIGFGPAFEQTIASREFAKKGDRFTFKGPTGGVSSVTLDFEREVLTVRARKVDLGPFRDGPQPVAITLDLGDGEAVVVRMVLKGKSLRY